jgi:integrase/recombinase XerC
MSKLDSLIDRYAGNLATRGLSAETIAARVREGVRFGAWLRGRRPRPNLEDVGQDLVVRYLQTRSAFRSRATVAGRLSHLRCLGEFLVEESVWRANPLRWVRGPRLDLRHHLPRRIGREQLQALWKAAEVRRQEHARYQSLCALGILYGTGLRLGELARLDVSDWDVEHFTLRIDGRKTGRERQVVVGEGVARCIEGYLPQRHNRLESMGQLGEQALLVNKQGVRLGSSGIGRLIGRLCRDAGLVRVSAHQFRHSCASELIEAHVPLPDVQRMLGHAAIASTMRYLDIAAPERAAAMGKHPVSRFIADDDEERKAS